MFENHGNKTAATRRKKSHFLCKILFCMTKRCLIETTTTFEIVENRGRKTMEIVLRDKTLACLKTLHTQKLIQLYCFHVVSTIFSSPLLSRIHCCLVSIAFSSPSREYVSSPMCSRLHWFLVSIFFSSPMVPRPHYFLSCIVSLSPLCSHLHCFLVSVMYGNC